jgi:hypothetical protein
VSYASGRADFAGTDADGAFWFVARPDGSTHVCQASAAQVAHDVRAALGLDPTLLRWDVPALRARVARLAAEEPAWRPIAARLGGLGPAASRLDVLAGLWLAYYQPHGLRFDALSLPATTATPPDAPLDGVLDGVACYDPRRDPDPALSAYDRADAARESTYGIRVRSGETPPSVAPSLFGGYAGPSDTVVLVGLALAAGAALWLWSTAPKPTIQSKRR